MQLDYSLTTPQERIACVEKALKETPSDKINKKTLSYMSDYILFIADRNQTKREKKEERPIITKNREITINKRQISYEEVVSNLENGEDGIYSLISINKNQILDPKSPITESDFETIPALQEYKEILQNLKQQFDSAKGMRRYQLKKTIIET